MRRQHHHTILNFRIGLCEETICRLAGNAEISHLCQPKKGSDMPTYKYQEIIDQMSLQEKIRFCSGADFWSTASFTKLKLPSIIMTDGPHGIRKITDGRKYPGASQTAPATCFPLACLTGCSWDRDLLHEMGAALAEEALQEGISIILGPGVNIKRNPLCGRNFEYFSEDPYLAGEMGENWIKGVQSKGIGVSLKHFAANNQENQRMSSDSIIDPRTLREIYLPAFEKAVKNGKPATVMCAYNKLNGIYCSDNSFLLRELLRDEWGYDGVILSDWGAINDRVEAFKAGMDLEMPSSAGFFDQAVIEAIKSGALSEERVNESVDRLLYLVFSLSKNRKNNYRYDVEAHHRLAQKVATNSAVLLKNQGALLPMAKNVRIALIGILAKEPRFQGAGSSWINPTRLTCAIDGFEAQGLDFSYYPGYSLNGEANDKLIQEAVAGAAQAGITIVFAGLPPAYEGEGFDRENMELPTEQNTLIDQVADANPGTVVVLAGGAPVEMPWLPKVKAVLHMYLPGQAGGLAAVEILTGIVNPSGKLAESHPVSYADVPSAVIFEEGGRQAQYREGIYVGYRYYDKAMKPVHFPFGHGLSYTTFEYGDLRLSRQTMQDNDELTVTLTLKNTGKFDGAEVVQLYVGELQPKIFRPGKELKEFSKIFLKTGEEKQVTFRLGFRSFACYDISAVSWIVPDGTYRVSIGASSQDIRLAGDVVVHGTRLPSDLADWPDWYASLRGKVTKQDFESLLGHPVEEQRKTKKGEYTLHSSMREMEKNPVIKLIMKLMESVIAKAYAGAGLSDPNYRGVIESLATNPLRSMVLSSAGQFSLNIAQCLVDLANGHPLTGLRSLLRKKS
jgi:beta-glucosidase